MCSVASRTSFPSANARPVGEHRALPCAGTSAVTRPMRVAAASPDSAPAATGGGPSGREVLARHGGVRGLRELLLSSCIGVQKQAGPPAARIGSDRRAWGAPAAKGTPPRPPSAPTKASAPGSDRAEARGAGGDRGSGQALRPSA